MDASRLIPVLRGVTSPPGSWRAEEADPARALVRRPFAPFLHELLVIDDERTRKYVTVAALRERGLSASSAFAIAATNLQHHGIRAEGGQFHVDAGDGYESSRLLLPGFLAAFSERVREPVAIVPHARRLVIAPAVDAQDLLALAAREWRAAGDPVSPCAYTVVGGRVVPWAPTGDAELAVRASRHALASREYGRQAYDLAEQWDVDVAAYSVGLGAARGPYSFCRWTYGEPTLLPETDVVVLQNGREMLAIPWAIAVPHLDPFVANPPRWHASRWPADPTLRDHAIDPDTLA